MLKCNKGWRRQINVTATSNIEKVLEKSKKWFYSNHHNPFELGNNIKNVVYAEELIKCDKSPCLEVRVIVHSGEAKFLITPRGKIPYKVAREVYDIKTRKRMGYFWSISEVFSLLFKNKLTELYNKFKYGNKYNNIKRFNFKHIDKIVSISQRISKYFMNPDILVVDFFITDSQVYIGETGLYPCGGFCSTSPLRLLKKM